MYSDSSVLHVQERALEAAQTGVLASVCLKDNEDFLDFSVPFDFTVCKMEIINIWLC